MIHSLKPEILSDQDLSRFHTFGVPAKARHWVRVSDEAALQALIADGATQQPTLVLGGGSNLLFQNDFDGLIIKNEILGKSVLRREGNTCLLQVGGGENWHQLVQYALRHEWGGLENLSLIPGSVGAAPIQNIGAYGVELQEIFAGLEAIDLSTGEKVRFSREECAFGYRDSVFKRALKGRYMITRVVLRLTLSDHLLRLDYGTIREALTERGWLDQPDIHKVSEIVCEIRRSKLPDPTELGNAGSFFKNPVISLAQWTSLRGQYPQIPGYPVSAEAVKVPAGWLIQTAGWKGRHFGAYGVHVHQALVLVNYGGATGKQIVALAAQIQESITDRFGINLETEVNII